LLRQLATELVGRTPTPEDLPKVTEAVAPRLRDVLPKVPESTAAVLLARVCHAEEARREPAGPAGPAGPAEPAHPVDAAVTAGAEPAEACAKELAELAGQVEALGARSAAGPAGQEWPDWRAATPARGAAPGLYRIGIVTVPLAIAAPAPGDQAHAGSPRPAGA